MKISFISFKKVIREILLQKKLRDTYTNSIPTDLVDHVFDNTYANSLAVTNDILIRELFEEAAEDVLWFLYDCNFKDTKILIEGREYTINSVEDYLEYVEKEFIFSET